MSNQESEPDATNSLSRDTIHDLLAHQRRRNVLAFLHEHGPLALPDLADELASLEHGTPLAEVPEDDVLRVYTSLWHVHIPKLAEATVVSYNQDRDVVALAENADLVGQFTSLEPTAGGETA